MTFDLNGQLAQLYRLSPNNSRISKHITQAKTALGITTPKRLSEPEKLAVYQYHVKINSQPTDSDTVETYSQHDSNASVEIISQADNSEGVETYSQAIDNEGMKNISQPECAELSSQPTDSDTVETFSQHDSVETFSQYRIAFYTTDNGSRKRQVIALDGFYIDALMNATGIGKSGVTAWIQAAMDGFINFGSRAGITKQVKYLIVRELMQRLDKAKG